MIFVFWGISKHPLLTAHSIFRGKSRGRISHVAKRNTKEPHPTLPNGWVLVRTLLCKTDLRQVLKNTRRKGGELFFRFFGASEKEKLCARLIGLFISPWWKTFLLRICNRMYHVPHNEFPPFINKVEVFWA